MIPVSGRTSFATIQSHPFRTRFAAACPATSSVSAANPTTSRGRIGPAADSVARISGFGTSSSAGAPAAFFSLPTAGAATRQSATAAAHTATSAGSAAWHAASIAAAVSTATTAAPAGSGSATGPRTSVTRAPSDTSAAAIACPCCPELRFAM